MVKCILVINIIVIISPSCCLIDKKVKIKRYNFRNILPVTCNVLQFWSTLKFDKCVSRHLAFNWILSTFDQNNIGRISVYWSDTLTLHASLQSIWPRTLKSIKVSKHYASAPYWQLETFKTSHSFNWIWIMGNNVEELSKNTFFVRKETWTITYFVCYTNA